MPCIQESLLAEQTMPDDRKPFGMAVKTWRRRLDISQAELARRMGLQRTYVCDIERGARNPCLETIEKLARALGISIAGLFSYESSTSSSGQGSNLDFPGASQTERRGTAQCRF